MRVFGGQSHREDGRLAGWDLKPVPKAGFGPLAIRVDAIYVVKDAAMKRILHVR
jgi:hypothetical protein